jgi:transcriptional regulator with PAS, ATPase and Fis domain
MIVAAARAIEERICLDYAKNNLFETNKYLEAVPNSISEGVIATNAAGVITGMNKVAANMLSRNSSEVIGTGLAAFVLVDERLDGFFRSARSSYSNESLILKTPQGIRDCTASANRVIPESGVDCGVVLTLKKTDRPAHRVDSPRGTPAGCTFRDIIGNSKAINRMILQAKQVARSPSSILILGESGSGKEILAQAIHNASDCRRGPFTSINCGAIPKELIQSELFGYAGGAFTGASRKGCVGKFQLADRGTLFLDEISEMPFEMQINLLRVLEERTVTPVGGIKAIPIDVRIIAATNKNLHEEVSRARFREDLYYRLNVISITVPPLRARKDDIPFLAEYYLKKVSSKIGKTIQHIDRTVLSAFESHDWPGNVRELINAIEYAANFVKGNTLHIEHLPRFFRDKKIGTAPSRDYQIMALSAVEKGAIQEALRHFHGNISRAAKALGIGRNTLYEKIRRYQVQI